MVNPVRASTRASNLSVGLPRDAALDPDNRRGNWGREWWRVYVALTAPKWRAFTDSERARRTRMSVSKFHRIKHSPEMAEAIRLHASNGLTADTTALAEAIRFNAGLPGKEGAKDRELWAKATRVIADGRERTTVDRALDLAADLAAGLARAHAGNPDTNVTLPAQRAPLLDLAAVPQPEPEAASASEPAEAARTALTDW